MNVKVDRKTLLSTVVLLVLLSVFFITSSMMMTKDKQITALESAVINSDVQQLKVLLSSDESTIKITEENVETLVAYLDNFKNDKKSLLEAIKNREGHELLSIKTKKKWFFFEKYVFVLNPYYIEFEVDEYVEGIEIIGVETLTNIEEGKVRSGPLFPKTYEINISYNTGYVEGYKTTKEINVTPLLASDKRIVKEKVRTPSVTVGITNGIGATVLLNGIETAIELDVYNKKIYGIPTDGSINISLKKSFPWGEVISEEHIVKDRTIAFNFNPVNEQVENDIKLTTEEFSESFNEAFQKNDVSILRHVTPYMRATFQEIINEYSSDGTLVSKFVGETDERKTDIYQLTGHEINHEIGLPEQEQYFSTFATNIIDENGTSLYSCLMYYDLTDQKWLVFKVYDLASVAQ